MSTQPGARTSPSAASSRRPVSSTSPTAAMRPPSTATSPVCAGAPVPSTTVAPRMIRSFTPRSLCSGAQEHRPQQVLAAEEVAPLAREPDLALLHEQDALGHLHREGRVLLDHEDGDALLVESL